MKPDYIAFLTLRVYSGTPLHDWIASGEFKMMEPPELMRETRLFLEHIDSDAASSARTTRRTTSPSAVRSTATARR